MQDLLERIAGRVGGFQVSAPLGMVDVALAALEK